ncbi:IclR family transcriptional regulator domain-containing protein [Sandarakinorhabdus rubra]|uniref:IclR family transcriptional regulator domain-containing protein n=1 Tax=Sandarakinorhabdus rubra TaxID=2672568 RepID=UPI0013DB1B66|nr:IclR family transcriptional regulator C-terminal domain-containing protein [Sandarakinorhabdus rubra]
MAVPKDPEYLSTLERGLKVLRAFDASRPEMALVDVAAATGLSPAVARRCLKTLVSLGYIRQDGRRFLLTPEVLAFGSAYLSSMNIETVAVPPLQALSAQTGDSVSLAVRSGREILYVVHIPSNRRIRIGAGVGTRFPLSATSMGKVLLAFQGEAAIEAFLAEAPLPRLTERTISDADGFRARLKSVVDRRYDSALDELDYGIVSVAVPLFDATGKVVAAINCSTSTTRISQDELVRTRLPLLQAAAGAIAAELRRFPKLARSLQGA